MLNRPHALRRKGTANITYIQYAASGLLLYLENPRPGIFFQKFSRRRAKLGNVRTLTLHHRADEALTRCLLFYPCLRREAERQRGVRFQLFPVNHVHAERRLVHHVKRCEAQRK